ncbi:MAG: MCP four helix bundle domain-containing protein [Magnetospirillum sp.]|nr:MCP four helix bundle domain-containing protein [Magnetospirillum sp.]
MRLSVKLKLALSFGLVLVLSAIAAWIGVDSLNQLDRNAQALVNGPVKRSALVQDIDSKFMASVTAEKNMILESTDAGMDRYEKEMLSLRDDLRGLRDQYRSLASEEGRRRIDSFSAEWERYIAIQDKVRELSRQNSNVKARDLNMKVAASIINPVLDTLHTISQHLEGGVGERARLQFNVERMIGLVMQAAKDQKKTRCCWTMSPPWNRSSAPPMTAWPKSAACAIRCGRPCPRMTVVCSTSFPPSSSGGPRSTGTRWR